MGTNLLRVTQMNAIYLDKEIYKTLLQIIQDSTKHLPPGLIVPIEPELHMLIKVALLYNSIYKNGSTFGQELLSIKYENMSKVKKVIYIMVNCFDYVRNRVEFLVPSHGINRKFFNIHMVMVLLNILNISIFLRNGVKPQLVERFLGLNHVYAVDNVRRQYESKYLARELLWNGFIEMLVHILPLINYHKIKRTIRNWNPFHKRPAYMVINNRLITIHSKCAHCGESPILPHHMGCPHVFCYVCLKGNQTVDSKYECPVCEKRNPNVICDKVSVI